jgi:hypothetical protein
MMWISLLYALIGGFLRRWYGGLFDKGILENRALQTVFMIGAFLTIYVTELSWKSFLIGLAVSCWLQFEYWSRGHGACFDIGRSTEPTEKTIKRYNARWYHIPCDWLVKKGFFPAYGVRYDFLYMGMRYTCPMLPMMYFDWKYILIGLTVAPVYDICWLWYYSKVWLKNPPKWLNAPTKVAEIIVGGITYAGCYLLGL